MNRNRAVHFPGATIGIIAATLVLVGTLAGCQAAQDAVDQAGQVAADAASEATAGAASKAVGGVVRTTLADAGITLSGAPDCTSDLTVDGVAVTATGTIDCTATTTGGKAVSAEFDGSLSPASCIGSLTINVQGQAPITVPRLDGCKIAAVLGGAAEGASS